MGKVWSEAVSIKGFIWLSRKRYSPSPSSWIIQRSIDFIQASSALTITLPNTRPSRIPSASIAAQADISH